MSTRPTRKNRTFSRQLFEKMSDPSFQTSDIPKGDLTPAGPGPQTKSTENVASTRSKTDAKILLRPLSLLTRSSSTRLFSQVFEAYCIHG